MSSIYKITNDVNGKIYVGKTEFSEITRFKQHINDSKKDRCKDRPLYRAMNKYGIGHFHVDVIEKCENDIIACKREKYWINKLRTYVGFEDCNGYNATLGGDSKQYKHFNIDEMINMYNQTHNIHIIANMYGIEESYVRKLLKTNGVELLSTAQLYREQDEHTILQLDANTFEIINIFHSITDANIYFKKNKYNGNIKDAVHGRHNGNHFAYGFNWYRKNEYIEKFGAVS